MISRLRGCLNAKRAAHLRAALLFGISVVVVNQAQGGKAIQRGVR